MPICPVCDNPHDTYGGLAVHMWKKEDVDHDMVESKDEGLIWLADNGHMGGDASESVSPADASDASPDTSGAGSTSTESTDGGTAVKFPQNPDATDATDDTPADPRADTPRGVCHGCGSHNVEDASKVARERPQLPAEKRRLLMQSDRVCVECGGVWDE